MLSNTNLISILNKSEYQGATFFQPTSRENDENTSSDTALSSLDSFPIIAMRDNIISLLVLKKINGEWKIAVSNNRALTHPHLRLTNFSLDNSSYEDRVQSVYFSFIDKNNEESELSLMISDIFPSYFTHFHTGNLQFVYNYDRGITLTLDYPFLGRSSYELPLFDDCNFEITHFSFSSMPISMHDLMDSSIPISYKANASVYLFPDDSFNPICFLGAEDKIFLLNRQASAS